MANILVVEDEEALRELIRRNLTLIGHTVGCAADGAEGLSLMRRGGIDLIILDIMLPVMDGFELMRRRADDTPVILLTAKASVTDRVAGLDMGADDYIVKPFDTLELIARINAVLRRTCRQSRTFDIDDVHIDLAARQAFCSGTPVELTPQEFALLENLILNRNLALSREKLLELAWDMDYPGDTRTVDAHIQKLRKKLGLEDRIVTVYKHGYRLEAPR